MPQVAVPEAPRASPSGCSQGRTRAASRALDVAIVTGAGEMRDQVVVLSCDAVVVCGMSAGTAIEAALAIKVGRPVVLLRPEEDVSRFFRRLGRTSVVAVANTPAEAIETAETLANRAGS